MTNMHYNNIINKVYTKNVKLLLKIGFSSLKKETVLYIT